MKQIKNRDKLSCTKQSRKEELGSIREQLQDISYEVQLCSQKILIRRAS